MSKKIIIAPYEGVLKLGNNELNCYVLSDGTRLISQNAVFKAFGRGKRGIRRITDTGIKVPSFMDAKNLERFIDNQLGDVISPIMFKDNLGHSIYGYKAEIIPLVCDLYLKARDAGALTPQQQAVAKTAEFLVRSLAKVGIISLIDEVTGYQYERERYELQRILKAYISEELLLWQKRFPDVFYKELFRLNAWEFNVHGIKKRPGVIGTWTKKLIYEQLPKGVLEELEKKTPKSKSGNYMSRLHQSLTIDIGEPHLTAQLNKVITLFQLSDNMKHMWLQFKKLKNREEGQLELPFKFDESGRTIEPEYEEEKLSDFNKKLKKAVDYDSGIKKS